MGSLISLQGLRANWPSATSGRWGSGYWNISMPIGNAGNLPSFTFETYYIVAPSFDIHFHNYFTVTGLACATIQEIYIYYYNGSSWQEYVSVATYDVTGSYLDGIINSLGLPAYKQDYYFAHNHSKGGDGHIDTSNYHLWKIEAAGAGAKWASGAPDCSSYMDIGLYAPFNSSAYSYHPEYLTRGKLIKYCNISAYKKGSPYGSDSAFVNANTPGGNRGVNIIPGYSITL